MHRHFTALLLCAVLLLSLTACGGSAPQATPAPAASATEAPAALASGRSYAEVYLKYLSVYGALLDEVERRTETHNAILERTYPDSYYMNSNYLMLVYVPFNTAYPALGSVLSDENVSAAQAALRTTFPDAKLTMTAPGRYEAEYTYNEYAYRDGASQVVAEHKGRCEWECDGEAESFRVRAWIDDELVEFTEFVPQGSDKYLLYTMTDLALVEYADGTVKSLLHEHRINDPALGSFPGDVRAWSLDAFDPFPRGQISADELKAEDGSDLQYVLTLENDAMTYTGKIAQDVLDAEGNKTGVRWIAIDPIVFQK